MRIILFKLSFLLDFLTEPLFSVLAEHCLLNIVKKNVSVTFLVAQNTVGFFAHVSCVTITVIRYPQSSAASVADETLNENYKNALTDEVETD